GEDVFLIGIGQRLGQGRVALDVLRLECRTDDGSPPTGGDHRPHGPSPFRQQGNAAQVVHVVVRADDGRRQAPLRQALLQAAPAALHLRRAEHAHGGQPPNWRWSAWRSPCTISATTRSPISAVVGEASANTPLGSRASSRWGKTFYGHASPTRSATT